MDFFRQETDEFPGLFFYDLVPGETFSRRQVGFPFQKVGFKVAYGCFEAVMGEKYRVVVFFKDESVFDFFPEGEEFFADVKVSGFHDMQVDGGECHGVDKGPELFEDVKGERRPAVGGAVEGTEVWVEAGFGEDACDAVAEECVVEA